MSKARSTRRASLWWALLGITLVALGIMSLFPVDWAGFIATAGTTVADTGISGVLIVCGTIVLAIQGALRTARARRKAGSDQRTSVRPLRWWWLVVIGFGITTGTTLALWWLVLLAQQSPLERVAQARIEAVRTALTFGAGLVGIVALVLTARRQWLAEHTQRHTEADTREQRATELYIAAAEQLASDKAPVRMAGLHALERLGQYNPEHRQTVVNLLCAYLRMPFTHPEAQTASPSKLEDSEPAHNSPTQQPLLLDLAPTLATAAGLSLDGADQQHQELQVRLTAQRILTEHLRPDYKSGEPTNEKYWPGMSLDLTGAILVGFDMRRCHVTNARFDRAQFHDEADFSGAQFHDEADFSNARFHMVVRFFAARFREPAVFHLAEFHYMAAFGGAQFHDTVDFQAAQFRGMAVLQFAQFHNKPDFYLTHFHRSAEFEYARFHGGISFEEARFHHTIFLEETRCRSDVDRSDDKWPDGWTVQEPDNDQAGHIGGLEGIWGYVVQESSGSPAPDETNDQLHETPPKKTDSV